MKDLMAKLSSSDEVAKEKEVDFDYEGYAILESMKLPREDVRKAFTIMWEICMELSAQDRDTKYLFGAGLMKSKEVFLEKLAQTKDMNEAELKEFNKNKEIFTKKLTDVQPLIDFLIKAKEVI